MAELAGEAAILLTPGPVSLSPAVAAALAKPLVFHRCADFHRLHDSIVGRLASVFDAPPSHDVLLLSGSGTLANEAMLSSALGPGDRALVLVNGYFAERLVEILRIHAVPHETLAVPPAERLDPAAVARALASGRFTAVVMVAMETGLGCVNPVREVGRHCADAGVLLFVDAVSALGVERLSVRESGISFCASVGNKGIGGAPGVSFVCADREALRRRKPPAPRGYYTDLHRHADFARRAETPTTPPVPVLAALDAALGEALEEGLDRRRSRCRALSDLAIVAAARVGATPLLPDGRAGERAAAVTTFLTPGSVEPAEIIRHFRAHGFVMHAAPVRGTPAFQVAVMGSVREEHLRRWARVLDTCEALARPA